MNTGLKPDRVFGRELTHLRFLAGKFADAHSCRLGSGTRTDQEIRGFSGRMLPKLWGPGSVWEATGAEFAPPPGSLLGPKYRTSGRPMRAELPRR
jgi:hypothetical protein